MKAVKEGIRKYYKYKGMPWQQPILTANGTMGGDFFAVSASTEYNSNYSAYKAFDNSTSTDWATAGTHIPSWITFYNPRPLKVSLLTLRNRHYADNTGEVFLAGNIYGSNDNSNWDLLTPFTNSVIGKDNVWTIDLSNNTSFYKYYKIEGTSFNGVNQGFSNIIITAVELEYEEGTPSDYDFYKDVPIYKAVKELVRKYYKYKTSANGYRQLTYIQSDGNQYIDLGISLGSATMEVNLDVQYISVNNSYFVGAGYDLGSAGRGVGFGVRGSKYLVIEPGSNWNQFGTVTTDRTQFKWVINGNTSTLTGYASNTVTSSSHFGTSCAWRNYNLTLFKSSNDSPIGCKMYSSDLLINDIKVRNLIPHERLFDNAIGLYDTENDVFYTNSGRGSFIKGDYIIEESTSSDYDFYEDVDIYKAVKF